MADFSKIAEAMSQTWPARLAKGAYNGFMAPGRALASEQPITTEQMIAPAMEIASLMAGGGLAGKEAGALASGPARMRMIENVDLHKELANQARSKGYATGKSAAGHNFKRPDAPKGSWERAVAEAKAGWEADKLMAVSDYQAAAPSTISKYMTPDDWAFIDSNIRRGLPAFSVVGIPSASALYDENK